MAEPTLHDVLTALYEAGARGVPADETGWTSDMMPAINHALTMQYVVHRETPAGRTFSLTEAGYVAIRKEPPSYMSFSGTLKALFRFGRGRAE